MHAAALRFHGSVKDDILVTGPGSVAVTISTGGVSLPKHGRTAEEAMSRAREALHLARHKGSGHFVPYVHSPARQAQRRANAALSTELVAALQERRLSLAFQPVVDIHTRTPHFHEALVRIARPGEIAASDFAAFAERLGLIRLIDRHVLDLALDVLIRTGRHISINVSADTVGDTEWMARLSTALAELFAPEATVVAVKTAIPWGFVLLVPALAAAGGSGFALAKGRRAGLVGAKLRRMPFIAANGILVLVPAAFFLASKARAGAFDAVFYWVQALELAAGATNIALLSLNMRDGLRLKGRLRRLPA